MTLRSPTRGGECRPPCDSETCRVDGLPKTRHALIMIESVNVAEWFVLINNVFVRLPHKDVVPHNVLFATGVSILGNMSHSRHAQGGSVRIGQLTHHHAMPDTPLIVGRDILQPHFSRIQELR